MNKYLVKPTFLHDKNGKKFSVEELLCDGNHEGGSSSGSTVDSTQLKVLETRVTTLEFNDENIGRQVANNQSTCENALREAQIAHNVASEVAESLDMVRSTADNAESKAVEARAGVSTLSTGYENLKTRVTHLEETAGTATVESVGRSIMGYNADFTEYGGGTYKTVEWGDEGNTVTFSREDTLGDLLEHMIYYTTTGITSNYNRIKALEQNGTGSGSSCNCPSDVSSQLTSHTNSIQTLETRTSSQGNSITSLENRMTDVETKTNGNSAQCGCDAAAIATLQSDVAMLKSTTLSNYIGDINIKEDGSEYDFMFAGEGYAGCTLNEIFTQLLPLMDEISRAISGIEERLDALEQNG